MKTWEAPRKRADIEEQYKWKLEDIYASDAEWEKEYEELSDAISKLPALEGNLASSGQKLAAGLKEIDEAGHKLERLYVYARMRRDEDNANPTYQALTDRATSPAYRTKAG